MDSWQDLIEKHPPLTDCDCHACAIHERDRLRLGNARYEALRLCTPRSFGELYARNMAGELFDDLVDELVKQTP